MITLSDIMLVAAGLIGAVALGCAVLDRRRIWLVWISLILMMTVAIFMAFYAGYRAAVIG